MQQQIQLDAVAIVGEYVDKSGETKKKYLKVGAAFLYLKNGEFDGVSILLDAMPFSGKIKLLPSRTQPQQQQQQE